MIRQLRISLYVMVLLITPASWALSVAESETMPVAELMTQTMQPQCVQWEITGICFWMSCGPFGCSFSSSIKVKHWNPDLAVEVKSSVEGAPLGFTALTGEIFSEIGSGIMNLMGFKNDGLESSSTGSVRTHAGDGGSSNLRFYDATVVGNPTILTYTALYGTAFGSIGWCASPAIPLQVYYDSLLDAFEWRVGLFSALEALTTLPHFLGPIGAETFGDLYPRIGSTSNSSPYKAASTLAFRAVHIAAQGSGAHAVLTPLPPTTATNRTFSVSRVTNTDYRWSNVLPSQSLSCKPMSQQYESSIVEIHNYSEPESYLKLGWRQAECCYRRGKTLLSH